MPTRTACLNSAREHPLARDTRSLGRAVFFRPSAMRSVSHRFPILIAQVAITLVVLHLFAPDTARAAATTAAPAAVVSLPSLPPKAGHLIGRAVLEDGKPVPEFTVAYHGFEDGKLATSSYGGRLNETVNSKMSAKNGRYEVKLPAGAYRDSAYVTYRYRERTYHFELEELNEPEK